MNRPTKKAPVGAQLVLYLLMGLSLLISACTSELTGVRVHMISGGVLMILVAAHVVLRRTVFIDNIKRAFDENLRIRTRLNRLLGALTLCLFGLAVLTGVLLAHELIPRGFGEDGHEFVALHSLFAGATFILIVVHIVRQLRRRRA